MVTGLEVQALQVNTFSPDLCWAPQTNCAISFPFTGKAWHIAKLSGLARVKHMFLFFAVLSDQRNEPQTNTPKRTVFINIQYVLRLTKCQKPQHLWKSRRHWQIARHFYRCLVLRGSVTWTMGSGRFSTPQLPGDHTWSVGRGQALQIMQAIQLYPAVFWKQHKHRKQQPIGPMAHWGRSILGIFWNHP